MKNRGCEGLVCTKNAQAIYWAQPSPVVTTGGQLASQSGGVVNMWLQQMRNELFALLCTQILDDIFGHSNVA